MEISKKFINQYNVINLIVLRIFFLNLTKNK